MIQPIRTQSRIPFLALVAVTLAVLVSVTFVRMTSDSASRTEPAIPTIVRADVVSAEHPVVQATAVKTDCSAGAYVSGDMAGETSPTEVYSAMCGNR